MKIFSKNKKLIMAGVFSLFTFLFCVLFSPSVLAWGPERTTFTMESPASYPTFNSITNNPTIGDERDFVRVGEINATETTLKNEVEVVPGRQYIVYIYFHNNASATYNDKEHDRAGIAKVTTLSSKFVKILTPDTKGAVSATVSADNANPGSVWDEAYFTTKSDKVLMRYVEGSAKIYLDSKWKMNGAVLPTTLFTETGTLLGLNGLNGIIPGCEEYHGVVKYVLQAEELKGTLDKTVSKAGEGKYEPAIENVKPGDIVDYQLEIRNAGDVALTNATIKDSLPSEMSLVPGSVKLYANDSTNPSDLSDNIIKTGYNLGTIGTGNVVYIRYSAKVGEDFDCKGKTVYNTAKLTYDSNTSTGDSKTDSAQVLVKKVDGCEEKFVEEKTCETNPEMPECQEEKKTCETNPEMEGCGQIAKTCETNPEMPECQKDKEKTCETNPEMEGCTLPKTGPAEIALASIIVVGLGIWGAYYFHTKKNLNRVKASVINGAEDKKKK
ncbi:DUF11 domain-containing protein [Candidatus Saccharibacteria bacterium]|nr:DUF11 domain-containing protein [Candidatus Saccharibacteria bacterium]